jgi:AcrR family transcriptional regulator
MTQAVNPIPGHRIRQSRSRKTYDALVAAAFELLREREFEDVTVAEISRAAGYSVGAFYARFRSKDELFDALVAYYLDERSKSQKELVNKHRKEDLVSQLVRNIVSYYWKHRRFWRAALKRSMRDPDFWEPIRGRARSFSGLLVDRVTKEANRALTEAEETNIRFAFQVVFGLINNAIINRPGPVFMGQSVFVENLTRAFLLVSDYENLVGLNPGRSQP